MRLVIHEQCTRATATAAAPQRARGDEQGHTRGRNAQEPRTSPDPRSEPAFGRLAGSKRVPGACGAVAPIKPPAAKRGQRKGRASASKTHANSAPAKTRVRVR